MPGTADCRLPTAGAGLLALLLSLPCAAATPKTTPKPNATAVNDVRIWIEDGNCGNAVDRLKTGLKKGYPEVALLAGSMYEHGLCVKRDWDKAVTFYAQAFEGDLVEGAERLAAGYADPVNGPDIAAALWWGRKARISSFNICNISEKSADDPDLFVAELAAWPRQRLETCNYAVGVLAMMSAEVTYPRLGLAYQVGGNVNLRFFPGVPRIDVGKVESHEYAVYGLVDGDSLGDRRTRKVSEAFRKVVGEVAERTLRRYPQPAGIPADAVLERTYLFWME